MDSSIVVASPLVDFSKTSGLRELEKGDFPHLSNKPDNQKYIGHMPGV